MVHAVPCRTDNKLPDYEGEFLARAAQQQKQFGAQRQARDQRARKGKKQNAKYDCRKHASNYKCFIPTPQQISYRLLRVNELSGSVARHLSDRHSAPKGERDETDGTATGDPEDEIRRSV